MGAAEEGPAETGRAEMGRALAAALAKDAAAAPDLAALGDGLVRRLAGSIPFDRFNIGLIDEARYLFHDAYVHGRNVAGRATGHERTLDGTVVEAAMRAGGSVRFGAAARARWVARFPRFGPVYDSGIRAMMAVMLQADGRTVGALVFASADPAAYGTAEEALAREAGHAVAARVAALAERERGDVAPRR